MLKNHNFRTHNIDLMSSFLFAPFPIDLSVKKRLLNGLLVGLFVALFLFLFKPFGISEGEFFTNHPYIKFLGFGVVTFIGMLIVDLGLPLIFPKFFEEKNYTLFKEILIGALTILIIAMGNVIYLVQIIGVDMEYVGALTMIWQTLLVGIFPLSAMTIFRYSSLLRSNVATSAEISNNAKLPNRLEMSPKTSSPLLDRSSENGTQEIDFSNLLYAEAVGNYVNVTSAAEGDISRNLYRMTLKSVAEDTALKHIRRCHRSYVVNLNKVIAVNGNAQGLKLTLNNCEEAIPVSRKYISEVKEYFNQANSA